MEACHAGGLIWGILPLFFRGYMDKLRDYIARTQQDRIALDTLNTLEEIKGILKSQKTSYANMPEITNVVSAPEIITTVKRTPRKPKGDM